MIDFLITILAVLIAMLIQIVIHESGHLVFGLLSGYEFSSFRIGSLMLCHDGERLKFCRYKLSGTGGQCLMSPPDMTDGKLPVVLFNLGGSIMNLIASAVFLVIMLSLPPMEFAFTLFFQLVFMGVLFALFNGIPMKLGLISNDGKNAISLSKDPAALRAWWIQLKANQMISEGTRLKDMPEEWFSLPSPEEMKNPIIGAIGYLSCMRLMDMLDFDGAMRQIELVGNRGLTGLHMVLLNIERIFLELVGENRPEELEKLFTKQTSKIMKSMKSFPPVLRVRYVHALLAEKDTAKAGNIKSAFDKMARSYPYPCEIEAERQLIAFAESRA